MTDLGEFNHMIRKQLGIGHTCVCKFCEAQKQKEAEEAVCTPAPAVKFLSRPSNVGRLPYTEFCAMSARPHSLARHCLVSTVMH